MQDATGSRKTLTRNRYGQVLTFTDCSGYETRYEYNHVGQVTAIHQEEGLSQYFTRQPGPSHQPERCEGPETL
jgi:YD repeat-containing protein